MDTKRTRAEILADLFKDNVSGQISPQDMRDFVVTVMPTDFVWEDDSWVRPQARYITTDKTGKGALVYSQIIDQNVSFGDVGYLTPSGTWGKADAANSAKNFNLAIFMDSYAAGASNGRLLELGIVFDSSLSGTFSGNIGRPVYLESGLSGKITLSAPSNLRIIGVVKHSTAGDVASGKWFFEPGWAVSGS